jgi:predicted Zn-dependent protease
VVWFPWPRGRESRQSGFGTVKHHLFIAAGLFAALSSGPAAGAPIPADPPPPATSVGPESLPEVGNPTRPALEAIITRLRAGATEAARRDLDAFLVDHPNNPLALEMRATIDLDAGDIAGAEQQLARVVALDPNSSTAAAKLGAARLRLGRIDEGLAELKRAIELEPGNLYAHETLGGFEASRGNDAVALSHYRTVLHKLAPPAGTLHPLHVRMAILFNRAGGPAQTLKLLDGRLGGNGDKALQREGWLQLIAAAASLDDAALAARAVEAAAPVFEAGDPRFAFARAESAALSGDTDAALGLLADIPADNAELRYRADMMTARLQRHRGDLPAAIGAFEAAAALAEDTPLLPKTLRDLATTLLQAGRQSEAITVLNDAAARHPDRPQLGLTLAEVEAGTGDRAAALKRVTALVAAHPDFAPAHDLRAQLLFAQGDKKGAYAEMKEATRLAPRNIGYWVTLSELAHDVEGHDAVGRVLRQGLEANPGQPDLMYDLALIEDEEGRTDAATEMFREILRKSPDHVATMISLAENLAALDTKRTEARNLAERARSRQPGDPYTQNGYAWIVHLTGDTQAALPLLESTAATLGREAMPKYRLAAAYAALGRDADARRLAQQALRDGLHNPERREAQKLAK